MLEPFLELEGCLDVVEGGKTAYDITAALERLTESLAEAYDDIKYRGNRWTF